MTTQQVVAITYQAEAHRTPSAVTKAANTDLTHDLKPRRLPPLQNYKTATAASPSSAPFSYSSSSCSRLVLKPPITPPTDSSSTSFSSVLNDPGPLGSAQRAGCSSVKQRRRAEQGPHWLLFSSREWHYWDPNPAVCMWPGNGLTPVPIAGLLEETRWVGGGGLRQLLLLDQSFSRGNTKKGLFSVAPLFKDQWWTFQRQLLTNWS